MQVTLRRLPSTTNGTFGVLFIENTPFCLTLERPAIGEYPCIPKGTYKCNRFKSPANGDCWLLENVPNRTMIEIHPANIYTELKGCIAPGRRFGVLNGIPAVLESKYAMDDLFKAVGNSFILVIE